MGHLNDFFNWVDGSQRIGNMVAENQLGAFREGFLKGFQDQAPLFIHRDYPKAGTGALTQHLPGNDVGMVFHGGNPDLVTSLQESCKPLGYQVDPFGGTGSHDDFMGMGGIKMLLDLDPRLLIRICSLLGKGMHPPVDIGIVAGIVIHYGVDDLPWGL